MIEISLVQQGAWDTPLESMPLAAAYIKATLEADPDIGPQVQVSICNFRGGVALTHMARELFSRRPPDILAFSVLGWNYRNFCCLAETYKQMSPDGLVVFGGNHVAYQAKRVFQMCPEVDVVVNGEGEFTFRDIVLHLLNGNEPSDLSAVPGVSYQDPDDRLVTTPDRPRIENLDVIPSPFLIGAIPMNDEAGRFRYDVALMETNRGCPYKCSFCYWGGAIGQRVRSFSRARLAEELDYFGFHEVPTVVLCDANFGMQETDEEFVEDLIKTRERYGYPHALETSWAKNKSTRFHRIVTSLKRHGFQSSFTLALQTLSDEALTDMQRRNMKVNQWESLATWLADQGLDCYAELIWGAPGETPQSFLQGYDKLAEKVSRIAVYPLLLLPNTHYTEHHDEHGFITVRGEYDDFEYVLASRSATMAEHLSIQQFMFFARILGENQYVRHIWTPARRVAGMSQSQVIQSVMQWFESSRSPEARAFLELVPMIAESPEVARGLRAFYEMPGLDDVLAAWWREAMVWRFPSSWREFASELYEYERKTRPRYVPPGTGIPAGWNLMEVEGRQTYVSDPTHFSYDIPAVLDRLSASDTTPPAPCASTYVLAALAGFYQQCDNHETAVHYFARPRPWMAEEAIAGL